MWLSISRDVLRPKVIRNLACNSVVERVPGLKNINHSSCKQIRIFRLCMGTSYYVAHIAAGSCYDEKLISAVSSYKETGRTQMLKH